MRPPTVEGGLLSEVALILGVLAALLVVVALVTARRPDAPLPDRADYVTRWQALHGDHDPRSSVWLRGWLAATWWLARPLARRGVSPHVVTAASVWLVAAAVLPAAAGGRWAILAAWLVVVAGVVDGLDGAVAALSARATRLGYVLDSLADRITDLGFLGLVVLVGGGSRPVMTLAVGCGALFLLHDYLRARAVGAGAGEVVVVTVDERPHRVLVLAATLHVAGVVPPAAAIAGAVGLGVMLLLAVVGLAHLTTAVTRRLLAADAAGDDRGAA